MSGNIPGRPPQVIIETNRLLLREVTPETAHWAHTHLSDEELKNELGIANDESLLIQQQKFANGMTMYDVSFKSFILTDKKTGILLGKCGFHTWRIQHSRAELGYGMAHEEYKNKGYMKEALKVIVAHGFEHMGLHRVEAFTASHNVPSKKLLKGLGFIAEGTLREHYFKNGRMEDSVCFSLLRHEYQALKHTAAFS